jgi:hypothetical protein
MVTDGQFSNTNFQAIFNADILCTVEGVVGRVDASVSAHELE